MARTKIIATLGPATADKAIIESLIHLGVNVFRLNFSHGDHDFHAKLIKDARSVAEALNRPIALLQDISGPKIRVSPTEPVQLVESDLLYVWRKKSPEGAQNCISINYPEILDGVCIGDQVYFADGTIRSVVESIDADKVTVKILTGGKLTTGKGVNLPVGQVKLSAITQKDKDDIKFGISRKIDLIALSFVQCAYDIREAKNLIKKEGENIPVFAKIEKSSALENIEDIIHEADGLMIARGDLGVEMGPYVIPVMQKQIIAKAREKGLPVIIATQMLMSMVSSPYPTRAEVSDIANAVLDGADAVMLSDETTIGDFPEEAVKVISATINATEQYYPWNREFVEMRDNRKAMAAAAVALSQRMGVSAIVTFTETGLTALMVARQRPEVNIIAVTSNEKTYRRLAVVWGVEPILVDRQYQDSDKAILNFYKRAIKQKKIDPEEPFVVTISRHSTKTGTTNVVQLVDKQSIKELQNLAYKPRK
ncbi:MAG: pyruvate kinase [Desulfobulbaceae bacterium]|nr:pyruvate kinase [Desulfobulbaceae bacterium]